MAREECIEQCSKTKAVSTLRKRRLCPTSEKTPNTPLSKDRNIHIISKDDTQPSNGAAARLSAKGHVRKEPFNKMLMMMMMVVVGVSFSTRLYKITEPPHVWWVKLFCPHRSHMPVFDTECEDLGFFMMTRFGVSAGTRPTLERWEATTSTGPSFLTSILPLEKWEDRFVLFAWLKCLHGNLPSIDLLPLVCCRCW